MKKIILSVCLSLTLILSPTVQADTTKTENTSNQQQETNYKAALKIYRDSIKAYRSAQMKARSEIKAARDIYKLARKNASTREARLEALSIFKAAKTAALALVPEKPAKPKMPTN